MAKYTTIANMELRIKPSFLARMADFTNTTADIDDPETIAVIERAIIDASNDIDSYLFGHLDMSVAQNRTMVEPKCADMAMYRLYKIQQYSSEENPAYDDNKRAFHWLNGVATGKLHTDDDPDRPESLVSVNTTLSDRVFDSDSLSKL